MKSQTQSRFHRFALLLKLCRIAVGIADAQLIESNCRFRAIALLEPNSKAFAAELTDGHQSWASLRMKEFAQKPVSVTYILLQHANWKLSNFAMFSVLLLFPSFTVELY